MSIVFVCIFHTRCRLQCRLRGFYNIKEEFHTIGLLSIQMDKYEHWFYGKLLLQNFSSSIFLLILQGSLLFTESERKCQSAKNNTFRMEG